MSARAILSAIRSWWLLRPVSMQACSPNWSAQLGFLVFELNPSHATYSLSRLIRGLSVAAGRVARIVSMNLYTHTRAEKKRKKTTTIRWGEKKKKKRQWSYFAMRLGLGLSFFFFSPCFFQNELETTRRKHPLPERKCIAAACIEPLDFFLLVIEHRHDNNQLLN